MASSIFVWPGMFTNTGSTIAFPVGYPAVVEIDGLITTPLDGYKLQNTTLSTAGVPVQVSPQIHFLDHVWNTTSVAADNTDEWFIYSAPVSGTTPSGLLKFGSSLNGSATTFPMTLSSAGQVTLQGGLTAIGSLLAGSSNTLGFTARSLLQSPSDGILQISNNAVTGFSRLILGTNDATTNGASLALIGGQLVVKTGDATAITGYGRVGPITNATSASIAAFTVGASDASFQVSANCNVTTSTTNSFSLNVLYTDESNASRVLVLPVTQLSGTFVATGLITNVLGVGPYEGAVMHIRAKASTSITIQTSSGGTYTGVVYTAEGRISQTA